MRIGMSLRGHGYHLAAWRHPDVPADAHVGKSSMCGKRAGKTVVSRRDRTDASRNGSAYP